MLFPHPAKLQLLRLFTQRSSWSCLEVGPGRHESWRVRCPSATGARSRSTPCFGQRQAASRRVSSPAQHVRAQR